MHHELLHTDVKDNPERICEWVPAETNQDSHTLKGPTCEEGSALSTSPRDRAQRIKHFPYMEISMAGKKFLNPLVKIVLCAVGMVVMGYFLYLAAQSGTLTDRMTIVRGLVFLGFTYLLAASIREYLTRLER